MKLFCFPHAGGFSNHYAFIKKADYDCIDSVYLYEYYGRNKIIDKNKPGSFKEFIEITADYVSSKLKDNEDYVLFGHSMGAFVAYETALKLSSFNVKPNVVFLSGQRPPCTVEDGYYSSDPKVALPFLSKLGGMESLKNTDPAVQRFFMPIILGDLKLLETYKPSVPDKSHLLGDCVLLHGDKDVELEGRNMKLWTKHFKNIRSDYVFDGGHFYLNNYKEQITTIINNETSRRKYDF